MAEVSSDPFGKQHVWFRLALLLTGLVMLGGLGVVAWHFFHTEPPRTANLVTQDATSANINDLLNKKDYAGLARALNKTSYSQLDKIKVQVAALRDQNRGNDALQLILAVEQQNKLDYSLLRSAAELYAAQQDKAKAIEYYNKALVWLKASDYPTKDDEIIDVNKLITDLQK